MMVAVEVTTADIADSKPRCPFACPLATALIRTLELKANSSDGVSVGPVILLYKDGRHYSARQSEESRAFINCFDSYGRLGVGPSNFIFHFKEHT